MNFENVVSHCSYLLQNSPQAEDCRNYLDKRLSKEMQEEFEFGYFPNLNNINLLTDFISNDNLKELHLFYEKQFTSLESIFKESIYFFEKHPLIMPYKDLYGNVVGLVGRSLLNDDERGDIAKYKNTFFKKGNHVFGLSKNRKSILEADFVYIVEGQFDMIKAFEKGIKNVVAIGNSNLTANQLSLICRYTKNIILLLDNDKAGDIGRERTLKKFKEIANIGATTYIPEGYKDLDDYLKTHDINSFSLISK